jgi:cyclic pyranopterin phosphate synthase
MPNSTEGRSVRMVRITEKENVFRRATCTGFIKLSEKTIKLIRKGLVEKGDPLLVAQIAAIQAAKKTAEILPLCHQIPLTAVSADFSVEESGVRVTVTVEAVSKTGVEMEALTAASVALLTIWDMVKAYEKDEKGQYPTTEITDIRVVEKVKGGYRVKEKA